MTNPAGNCTSPAVPSGTVSDRSRYSSPQRGIPAGNTSTGWLKMIALAFMLIDHIGAVIFTDVPELRMLGRIAFPIYCWCMVVGFHYTRSVPRYLLRILAVGLISQPLYAIVMNHLGLSWNAFLNLLTGLPSHPEYLSRILNAIFGKPNIFLTLFLGLAGLWGIREKKYFTHLWGPVAVLILADLLGADYGWRGVLFILLLYACRTSRPAIAAVMIAFFLFWGTSYGVTKSILGVPVNLSTVPGIPFLSGIVKAFNTILSSFLRMETYGLLSLPFILIPFRRNLRLPVWISYGVYPAHLFLILLLKAILL